jgi:hypothetical protein
LEVLVMVRPLVLVTLGVLLGASGTTIWSLLRPKAEVAPATPPGLLEPSSPPGRSSRPAQAAPVLAAIDPAGPGRPGDADDPAQSTFARLAASSGTRTLDPGFIPHMMDNLARGVGALARLRGGQMLALRCEARACMALAEWPAAAPGQPEPDPALLGPAVPGCTREVQRLPAARAEAGPAVARFAFHYLCARWIDPAAQPDVTVGAPTPPSALFVPDGKDLVASPGPETTTAAADPIPAP